MQGYSSVNFLVLIAGCHLVAGDFNVQPSRLGGAKDPKPRWATAFTHLAPALAALADDLIIRLREVPQVTRK